MAPKQQSYSPSLGGRPVWIERDLATRIKIPHTFVVHTYTRPTVCGHCKKLLKGIFKQGLQCKDCQYNTHKKCMDKIPKDCTGENLRDNIGITRPTLSFSVSHCLSKNRKFLRAKILMFPTFYRGIPR